MTVAVSELQTRTATALVELPQDEAAQRLEKWRRAFPGLDSLIISGASPASAMRRLGLTFWAAGQTVAAVEALGESVALDPGDSAVWLDLGFAHRACAQTRDALAAFVRAAELAPHSARAWLAIGLAAKELRLCANAEAALEKAVALDDSLDDAAYALGLIGFEARRYAEAAHRWRPLAAKGYRAADLRLGLGHCQFFLGEFGAAAASLAAHLASAPGDPEVSRRLALACFLDGAIHGGPDAGWRAYQGAGGAETAATIARAAVPLLSAYGYPTTALALAQAFLAGDADDPVHSHHLAALAAEPRERAPAEYVTAYFDRFADTFDEQLYGVLQYDAPRKLYGVVTATGAQTTRTLDLGCGTGAAGALLRQRATRLEGVDLSARMLEKAGARGVYDELAQGDMVAHLAARKADLDLVFAADAVIYLGDLKPLLEAAAGALVPGGSLAMTLEITGKAPYELTASGRFAHSPRALIAAAAPWFSLRASRRAFLRLEAHRRMYGALIVLERRG